MLLCGEIHSKPFKNSQDCFIFVSIDNEIFRSMNLLMNILWLLLGGIFTAIEYLIASFLMMITIIGIPFGLQHFKLAALALSPFGKDIITV